MEAILLLTLLDSSIVIEQEIVHFVFELDRVIVIYSLAFLEEFLAIHFSVNLT